MFAYLQESRALFIHAARYRELAKANYSLPVESYAAIRRQLLVLLREVNRYRKSLGKSTLPVEVLPMRRRVVRPFDRDSQQCHLPI